MNRAGRRLGGHLLVESLIAQGVDLVFGVPGGSDLVDPDFAAYARTRVRPVRTARRLTADSREFAAAFERCAASGRPALIGRQLDRQAITPNITLDRLRAQEFDSHLPRQGDGPSAASSRVRRRRSARRTIGATVSAVMPF